MRRVAYLTHGMWFEHALMRRDDYAAALTPLYLPVLRADDLRDVDVAVVGSRGDADVRADKAGLLLDFWRAGGDLVALDQPPVDWLPDARYEFRETNFWWWREPGGDLPIELREHPDEPFLAGLELADVKWHHHGVYHPPPGARTLVATPDDGAVLYAQREAGSGTLIATTMDPDYHTGQGFIPKAEGLLRHVLSWAARG